MKRLLPLLFFLLLLAACGPATLPTQSVPQATPTTIPFVLPTFSAAPQIIRQNPLPQERLSTAPTIEITFDRPMEQTSLERAWKFVDEAGKVVVGAFTWKDAQTVQFRPATPLQAGHTYILTIGEQATDQQGIRLGKDWQFTYRTTEALQVSQVFPANGTLEADPNTALTIVFNKPVVPISPEETPEALPSPVEFEPPIPGQGRWVSSSVYIFQPEKPLRGGQSYRGLIRAGLQDTSGTQLEEDFRWEFRTRPLRILEITFLSPVFVNEEQLVRLDGQILVRFDHPIERASLNQALRISAPDGHSIPFRTKWNETSDVVTIIPLQRYHPATRYTLTFSTDLRGQDGSLLNEPQSTVFFTLPYPAVISFFPSTEETFYVPNAVLQFNTLMNRNSVIAHLRITPRPPKLDFYYDEWNHSLIITGLEPGQTYEIRLRPGAQDIYGNATTEEYTYKFANGYLAPSAWLKTYTPTNPLIFRQAVKQEVYLEYANIETLELTLYALTPAEFKRLSDYTISPTDWRTSKSPLRVWKLDLEKSPTETRLLPISLEENGKLPPGLYLLGVRSPAIKTPERFASAALLIVSEDLLTLKAAPGEGLAWLLEAESGHPTADVEVSFYDQDFNLLGTARTDAQGLAHWQSDTNGRPAYAVVNEKGHVAMASPNWSGLYPERFGIYQSYQPETHHLMAFLYTERPIYRPGQKVYFKGIVRLEDDLRYSLPTQTNKVTVFISDQDGILYRQVFSLTPQGAFFGEYTLSEDAPVGTYTIQVYEGEIAQEAEKGPPLYDAYFRVAEYVKPRFRLDLEAEPTRLVSGETTTFRLNAAYYSGGNLSQAPLEWFIETAPAYYSPPEAYSSYSFQDWEETPRCAYGYPCRPVPPPTYRQGSGKTDEQGNFEHQETFLLPQNVSALHYTFNVNVQDIGGNVVGGYTTVTVFGSSVFPGVRTESYLGEMGKPIPIEMVALNLQGEPVPNQRLSVALYEQRWFNVQKKDASGVIYWESSVQNILRASTVTTTDANGKAVASLTPPSGGEYKIVVTATDEKGRRARAASYVWVIGKEMYLQRTSDDTLQIISDKSAYNPGEKAQILIVSPFQKETIALLTLERGRIHEKKLITLESGSNTFEIPITSGMAPVMYVSVVAIQAAEGPQPPRYAMGLAKLSVAPSLQQIFVQLESDRKVAQPRQQVTFTVLTRDVNGKPVSADVSLALVDKALLALTAPNSPPLLEAFYPLRGLNILTASTIPLDAERFNAELRAALTGERGRGGSGGGEKGLDQFGILTVRGEFKDTAFWQAQVITNENGRAEVTVTLPDNLTTWQLAARAITADTRVGEAILELPSRLPLQIELQTPRFFVAGDQVTLGAMIHNNTDTDLNVKVLLESQGFLLQEAAEQSLIVKANGQAYITWRGVVDEKATRVDLIASVRGGGYEDATRPVLGTLPNQGIPVLRYLARETIGSAGILTGEGSITESILLPPGIHASTSTLIVDLSPSLAATAIRDLEILRDYPYLCSEQTVSRFLPNLLTRRLWRESGQSDRLPDIELEILQSLQRLIRTQNGDGGWSLWPGGESELRTTAYVVWGLSEARAEGYSIPDGTLKRGLNYLQRKIYPVSTSTPLEKKNEIAFVAFVLAQQENAPAGVLRSLYKQRDSLSHYARAFLLDAFLAISAEKTPEVSELLSGLSSAAIQSAAGVHWEESEKDFWNWNTDLRSTAIILDALMRADPKHPLIPGGIHWLMTQRRAESWLSTQEITWTLLALSRWLEISGELKSNYQFGLGLNGQLLESKQVTPENIFEKLTRNIPGSQLTEGQNTLSILRTSGPGTLFYTAYMEYALPAEQIHSQDHGILVERAYFRLNNLKKPVTEVARGELVQVRLTLVVPEDRFYVLVEDPLPAGLEPVDATLLTSIQVPERFESTDYEQSGWGQWYFNYRQIYDDRVVFSADYLPAGTYVLTYLARAGLSGTFHVLPTQAREFYFPDVSGRSEGLIFIVK